MDRRISEDFQLDDRLYGQGKKDPVEKVYFDRGHMVRLLDPCWGDSDDDAKRGQIDTFHFTNAAPQEGIFNDVNWGNLEDYILEKAQISERKLTVLTGPIFRGDDPKYGFTRKGGPWQIPISFWKIAVLQKTDTKIAVAAFVRGQTDRVQALYEAKVFTGLKPFSAEDIKNLNIQTTLAAVEGLTGLNFEVLKPFETVRTALEATRYLGSVGDVEI
jgi:endonuclease G